MELFLRFVIYICCFLIGIITEWFIQHYKNDGKNTGVKAEDIQRVNEITEFCTKKGYRVKCDYIKDDITRIIGIPNTHYFIIIYYNPHIDVIGIGINEEGNPNPIDIQEFDADEENCVLEAYINKLDALVKGDSDVN